MSPRVETFDGIVISVYFKDHNPPHFHVDQGGDEAVITIRDLTVLHGNVRGMKAVKEWAAANRDALIKKWNECNPNKPY